MIAAGRRSDARFAVVALLVLAGCASSHPVRDRAMASPVIPGGAVIVSARRLTMLGGRTDIRRSILGALGGGGAVAPSGETEFILRQDGGQTLSVVQAAGTEFQPGQRVSLEGGGRLRLVPLAGG